MELIDQIQLNFMLVIIIGAGIAQWVYWQDYGLYDRAVRFDSRQDQKIFSSALQIPILFSIVFPTVLWILVSEFLILCRLTFHDNVVISLDDRSV
jgi:hypothetical protein